MWSKSSNPEYQNIRFPFVPLWLLSNAMELERKSGPWASVSVILPSSVIRDEPRRATSCNTVLNIYIASRSNIVAKVFVWMVPGASLVGGISLLRDYDTFGQGATRIVAIYYGIQVAGSKRHSLLYGIAYIILREYSRDVASYTLNQLIQWRSSLERLSSEQEKAQIEADVIQKEVPAVYNRLP